MSYNLDWRTLPTGSYGIIFRQDNLPASLVESITAYSLNGDQSSQGEVNYNDLWGTSSSPICLKYFFEDCKNGCSDLTNMPQILAKAGEVRKMIELAGALGDKFETLTTYKAAIKNYFVYVLQLRYDVTISMKNSSRKTKTLLCVSQRYCNMDLGIQGSNIPETTSMVQQLQQQLTELHMRGVFHTDIKAENIMVIETYNTEGKSIKTPVFVDFGSAIVDNNSESDLEYIQKGIVHPVASIFYGSGSHIFRSTSLGKNLLQLLPIKIITREDIEKKTSNKKAEETVVQEELLKQQADIRNLFGLGLKQQEKHPSQPLRMYVTDPIFQRYLMHKCDMFMMAYVFASTLGMVKLGGGLLSCFAPKVNDHEGACVLPNAAPIEKFKEVFGAYADLLYMSLEDYQKFAASYKKGQQGGAKKKDMSHIKMKATGKMYKVRHDKHSKQKYILQSNQRVLLSTIRNRYTYS